MENIIVACSNILCILPIRTALMYNDMLTTLAISMVSFASFASHLIENHKHNMLRQKYNKLYFF